MKLCSFVLGKQDLGAFETACRGEKKIGEQLCNFLPVSKEGNTDYGSHSKVCELE